MIHLEKNDTNECKVIEVYLCFSVIAEGKLTKNLTKRIMVHRLTMRTQLMTWNKLPVLTNKNK